LAEIEVDAVFAAVGWPANLEGLGLEAAKVETFGGRIVVDEFLETTAPHVFAAGDATGLSMLAQSAVLQAGIAAENAVLGRRRRYTTEVVAGGSFTDPEYAGVGLTGQQARARGGCHALIIPYRTLTRAIIEGLPDGFCKVIVDRKSHELLGAHVVGAYSAEVGAAARVPQHGTRPDAGCGASGARARPADPDFGVGLAGSQLTAIFRRETNHGKKCT
jgi:pyruvate/2-oxoglutarate dehydrogenase complex dihydrolipoamide dehydrogenase (E3) component